MASIIQDTLSKLSEASSRSDAILVAYSGGKDSLVVLDLCMRSFKHVECFFMYFVPGLRCVEEMLDYGRKRWGVKINQYPHWMTTKSIRDGIFCPNYFTRDDLPEWKLRDIYNLAMAEAGIPIMATGAKKADSLWRKRQLATWGNKSDTLYPIVEWNKLDVISYLRARNIPVPASSGKSATGIDLSTPSLLWLHDSYPDDFRRVCEVFPYAEAVVYRRRWYGVK
jgi:phosphoadenosine phosphosulfate reductase